MNRKSSPLVALCLAVFASAASAQEGTPPQDRYWLIHQEVPKPSMLAEFVAAAHEFAATVKANKAAMPHFDYFAFAGEDLTYTFASPIPNFGGVDAITADFGSLAQALGAEKFGALMARGAATIDRINEWVVVVPAGLSYEPAEPRLKPEEMKFFHFDFYAVIPGREAEAEALAKEFAALYRAKGVRDGYTFNKVALGPDMPLYFVSIGARDAADFYTAVAEAQRLTGDEGGALFLRAMALTREFRTSNTTLRLDLSVPPTPTAGR